MVLFSLAYHMTKYLLSRTARCLGKNKDGIKVSTMAFILFTIALCIFAGLLFWVQGVVYDKFYESEDEDDDNIQ